MMPVPSIRVHACNDSPVNNRADYVLYWMIAARRVRWNFALDRAMEWCERLSKPLVILEALRFDFPWGTPRIRAFVAEGMAANAGDLRRANATYYPYVEPASNHGKGLLVALASRAAVVVTDEFPCFFLPKMVAAAAGKLAVRLEQVDSNGLLPLRAAPKEFPTAFAFRRFLQSHLPQHFLDSPESNPVSRLRRIPRAKPIPKEIPSRWPPISLIVGTSSTSRTRDNKNFAPLRGGSLTATKRLTEFLRRKLASYDQARNEPDQDAASGLSPYLHFGHISAHQILAALAKKERWTPARVALRSTGKRTGWWGMSVGAEAFLDQFITWRELGFNFCFHRKDYDRFSSLPDWARKTLADHEIDPRPYTYAIEDFAGARTRDQLWNATQNQLVAEGRMHNYLRMLWGKKILEWTRSPREALRVMIELNNRYALDGRDPNSYSGIFWCLGRYDRPWGPERPIFGTVRYMSSANTLRKLDVGEYLRRYAPGEAVLPASEVARKKAQPSAAMARHKRKP